LSDSLQPGQILSQEDLCLRFETSRMPVRDALLQLAHEGFLERLSGHRLRVVKLERIDFLDMIWIEATVHALAVKRATERHSSDVGAFGELATVQQAMRDHFAAGDMNRAAEVKGVFHRTINRMAESPKLISTLRSVTLGIQYDFMIVIPDWLERSVRDQDAVLNAMVDGEAELAARLMYEHLQASASEIASVLVGSKSAEEISASVGVTAALGALIQSPPGTSWAG
jgi:DNA-binding GntR family transcriptional regulator